MGSEMCIRDRYIDLVNIFVTRQGLKIDLTDDRIDPRDGYRFQYEKYGFEGEGLKNFDVEDHSLTAYYPNEDLSSVLVANVFFSKSNVKKRLSIFGDTDVEDTERQSQNVLRNQKKRKGILQFQ